MTASLLGIIAQHSVASPPPATVAAPLRKGKPVSTAFTSGTSVTGTLPQTPTAGNLLIAVMTMTSSTTSGSCTTPTGWTAGPTQRLTSGSNRIGLFTFWKLATGSESNPLFTVAAGQSGGVVIQEWAGLDTTAPHLADGAGSSATGTGTLTLTDAITTTTANEWVFSVVATNPINSMTPTTWTLPQLSFDLPTNSNQQVRLNSSTQAWAAGCYPTPGAQAPQAVTTIPSGTPTTYIASMSFKLAAGSRAQVLESAYTEYSVANAGSWAATLATTPDPADVLICAVMHADTLGAVSISGCGATWTLKEAHDTSGGYDMHVWAGINPTGPGTVTVTSANGRVGKIRLLRVSGVGQSVTTAYNRVTGASTATGPTVVAGPSQLVVALQSISATSSTDVPIASATPALGNWATDALLQVITTSGSSQDAWTVPAAPGTNCSVSGTSATTRDWPTVMAVVG